MKAYLRFVLRHFLLLLAVVFGGISAAFFVTHLSPINPVDAALSRMVSLSNFSPAAVNALRQTLTELYGVDEPLFSQFVNFWQRFAVGDLGPSLIAFPTPAMTLVWRALPWTAGLLLTGLLIAWVIGNVLGGLAGYYQNNRWLKAFGIVSLGLQPIPPYVISFILVILFGYLWPVLPISGGFDMSVRPGLNLDFIVSILLHSILPALALVIFFLGTSFLGMRSLVSNIISEDYVTYAELAGVPHKRIVFSYVIRNGLVPQVTGLAMSLGNIFSATVIIEAVFTYPGVGSLLVDGVYSGDWGLVLAVCSVSIVMVAGAIFIVDLLHPLLDPRVKAE